SLRRFWRAAGPRPGAGRTSSAKHAPTTVLQRPRPARTGRVVKRGEAAAARRYARALLEVAFAAAEGNPGALRAELQEAAALLQGQADLDEALTSPAVPAEAREKIVDAVWKDGSVLLRRLLHLLAQRNRLALLPDVARAFGELWNAARGTVPAEAVSA